jgi:predicted ATPase/DNA-binding CsgD family transcriptional regulator
MKAGNACIELQGVQEISLITREGKTTAASHTRPPVPVPLTSFIGREQEIASICALLRRPEIRLLTLSGTGGVGKTRLSLQVAACLRKDFADQIYFVSLMEISDPALVIPTIAWTLGLEEVGSRPLLEHVQAFLKERRMLLLLDNFEQVVDAAPVLAELLQACPDLKVLATSRAVLHISGEHIFAVSPLALPDAALLPLTEDLDRYPAITLFSERARAVLPDFLLNKENRAIVAAICIHLDGLPLAIELAVPRLRVLSPKMLLERLSHLLQVLTHGMRDAPTRQQTLLNTLEWSYRLLNPHEQRLFRFLSIFVGGCTFSALETAWDLAGHGQEENALLEGVTSLLDKSMLYRSTREAEEPRLLLLRTVREYGRQCLSHTGELAQAQWAHATYYLRLAEEAEPALKGPQPRPWLELLQREHDNLREALCFFIAQGAEMALRMGKALERFWIIGGHVKEGRDLLEQALKADQNASAAIRGHALCILAALARYQGDFQAATAACEESLSIFRGLDDPVGIAGSLYRLGYVAWTRGDAATARAYYEESLLIAQGEACRDERSEALYCFASLAFFECDTRLARLLIDESLALSQALNDSYNITAALSLLGWIVLLQGDCAHARALQEESLQAARAVGNQRSIAHILSALAEIAYRTDDFEQACAYYEESLTIILKLDDRWILAVYLEGLARTAVALGESIWAVQILSAVDALRRIIGASMTAPLEKDVRERTQATLHERLGKHAFATAWAEGQAMSPEQVVVARHCTLHVAPISSAEKRPAMKMLRGRSLHDDLTQRERDVLCLVAQGLTDAQVAEQLVISPRTVNFHLTSIYRKLQVSSRSAATRYVLEQQLFE